MASSFIVVVTLIPRTWNLLITKLLVGQIPQFLGFFFLCFCFLFDLSPSGQFLPLHFGCHSVKHPNWFDAVFHHEEGLVDETH